MKEHRFTFKNAAGEYPIGRDGGLQWVTDKALAATTGKSWGASHVLTMERCEDRWFIVQAELIEGVARMSHNYPLDGRAHE
jgi:hypothetical protein